MFGIYLENNISNVLLQDLLWNYFNSEITNNYKETTPPPHQIKCEILKQKKTEIVFYTV